jgi:uncharacterized LabA/DUF88 family protein
MIANVYVDGFNLYYALKQNYRTTTRPKTTLYRWLNLAALCRHVVQGYTINRIRYFTARVKPWPGNPDQALRQDIYLRALRTIPNLTIHEGHFLTNNRWSVIANPPAPGLPTIPGVLELHAKTGAPMAYVVRTDEKGSDVNLATYLLLDAFRKEFDIGVLITNDSDLAEPIRVVRSDLGREVGVLNPHQNESVTLKGAATWYRRIKEPALRASQFPPTVTTPTGILTKPAGW